MMKLKKIRPFLFNDFFSRFSVPFFCLLFFHNISLKRMIHCSHACKKKIFSSLLLFGFSVFRSFLLLQRSASFDLRTHFVLIELTVTESTWAKSAYKVRKRQYNNKITEKKSTMAGISLWNILLARKRNVFFRFFFP